MTFKQYDVNVRFTVGAADHRAAFHYVLEALYLAEQGEQIPDWEILDVVEVEEPGDNYHARLTEGETAP